MPGLSINNDGSLNSSLEIGCRHGSPGILYSVDLDILTVNKEGTYTTKRVFLYGNATNQLSFKTLDIKNHTKLVLNKTSSLTITQQLRTNFNTSITLATVPSTDTFNLRLGLLTAID